MTKEEREKFFDRIRNGKPEGIPLEELYRRTGVPPAPPDDPIFHLGALVPKQPQGFWSIVFRFIEKMKMKPKPSQKKSGDK